MVDKERIRKRTSCKSTGINFVKEGARPENKKGLKSTSVFDRGGDWEIRVDLDREMVFPEIVDTTLRPDMVLWSRQVTPIVAIELTVILSENCNGAHQRKSPTYISDGRLLEEGMGDNTASYRGRMISVEAVSD